MIAPVDVYLDIISYFPYIGIIAPVDVRLDIIF